MINTDQCNEGLIYNSFSIILFQTFTTNHPRNLEINENKGFVVPLNTKASSENQSDTTVDNIDNEIFTHKATIVKRYGLPSFDVDIIIDERKKDKTKPANFIPATLKGKVIVKAAVFFDNTVQLTYRIVVDLKQEYTPSPCLTNRPIDTNEMIALASIVQQSEHWSLNKKDNVQAICETLESVKISGVKLSENSKYSNNLEEEGLEIEEVMRRHHNLFEANKIKLEQMRDQQYTLVDVWENFGHQPCPTVDFDKMSEDLIIEHIEKYHKNELIGLMSFYPKEWPYRMAASYDDICGRNIAIDTDDLVLANQNMCLIFGTYGKRGEESETDWKEHLAVRNIYNNSWPEYVAILEFLLVKKQTINYALGQYIASSDKIDSENTELLINKIDENAQLCIDISNRLLKLNVIHYLRFAAHKHMYRLTSESLRIVDDKERLDSAMTNIDNALINANNVLEARQSERSKNILYFISIASLFGILLESDQIPMITRLTNEDYGVWAAGVLEGATVVAIIIGMYMFISSLVKVKNRRRR
ncbi:MAG: hypothetical protein R3Y15_04245 [Rikenellaceae bacterium]